MKTTGNPASSPRAVIDALVKATNDHDLDALVGCFAPDYVNETPMHPLRSFTGSEQVRGNWAQIFAVVSDLVAEVIGWAEDSETVWTEWAMSGTRRDGTVHQMAGVVIFTVREGLITSARFYLEPVETSSGDVKEAVREQMAGRS